MNKHYVVYNATTGEVFKTGPRAVCVYTYMALIMIYEKDEIRMGVLENARVKR